MQSVIVDGNFIVEPHSYQDYQISIPQGASNIVVSGQYTGTIFLSQPLQAYLMNVADFQDYWQNQSSQNNTSLQKNCTGACFEITSITTPETYFVSGTSIAFNLTIENTGTYEATPELSFSNGNVISFGGANVLTLNPGQSENIGLTATAIPVTSPTKDTVTFVVENTGGQVTDSKSLTFTVLPLGEYAYYSDSQGNSGSIQVNLTNSGQNYFLVLFNPDSQSQNVSADVSMSYQISS